MAEYIEREAVIKFVKNYTPILTNDGTAMKCVERSIRNAPAADVVEVVRCKDCEYYEIGKSHTPYCNNVLNMFEEMKPDDFCSYGERRAAE